MDGYTHSNIQFQIDNFGIGILDFQIACIIHNHSEQNYFFTCHIHFSPVTTVKRKSNSFNLNNAKKKKI